MNPLLAQLVAEEEEAAYAHAEREGKRLDSLPALCPECPEPGLCMAEDECQRGEAPC